MSIDTQVDTRLSSKDESAAPQAQAASGQRQVLSIAARYLAMAMLDDSLDKEEKAVHDALETIPEDAQASSVSAALSRFVGSAQTSGQRMTGEERELILEFVDTLRSHPKGELPGLQNLLGLLNDLVSNGTPDRDLTAPEQQVIRFMLSMVRSGQIDGPTLDRLLNQVRHLSMEGADLFKGAYSGLTQEDAAAILQEGQAAPPAPAARNAPPAPPAPPASSAPPPPDSATTIGRCSGPGLGGPTL